MRRSLGRLAAATLSMMVLALLAAPAQATRLTVRAVLPDGSAAGAGVQVVVTNNAGYRESAVTGNQSRVRFGAVPEGAQTITIERGADRGRWQGNVSGRKLDVNVTLESVTYSPQSIPAVPVLRINDGADCVISREVALNNVVSGPVPKSYRASEDRSLVRVAPWRLYDTKPIFELSDGAGTKTVYFQVQSFESGSAVDSEIVSDTIEHVEPKANATLQINGGAATAYNRTVTLNNTTSFDPPGTNPRYLASEDPSFADSSDWLPYDAAPNFTLSAGVGTKTVHFVVVRNICGKAVGNRPVSDTIGLAEVSVGVPPPIDSVVVTPIPTATPVVPPPVALRPHEFIYRSTTNLRRPIEAIRYAEEQGFTHSESRTRGDGSCARRVIDGRDLADERDRMWFSANPVKTRQLLDYKVEYLTCEFALFGGRRLNPGWRVSIAVLGQMSVKPTAGIVTFKKAPSGDDLSMTIEAAMPGGTLPTPCGGFNLQCGEQAGIIEKLVLEGPTNDWHDAFRQ